METKTVLILEIVAMSCVEIVARIVIVSVLFLLIFSLIKVFCLIFVLLLSWERKKKRGRDQNLFGV